jgi:hypothetical protein
MLRVGLELTTPVFERAKTVHALDREGHCDQLRRYIVWVIDTIAK